jgi:hypothetical protein
MLVSGDSPLNGGTLDQLSAELGRIELELRAREEVASNR